GGVESGTAPSSPGCRPPGLPSTQFPSTTDTCRHVSSQKAGAFIWNGNGFRTPLPQNDMTLDVSTAAIAGARPFEMAGLTAWPFTRRSVCIYWTHQSARTQQNAGRNSG